MPKLTEHSARTGAHAHTQMRAHTYMNSSHANEKFLSLSLLPCRLAGGCSGSGVLTMSRRNSETILFCGVRPTLPPPLTPPPHHPHPAKKSCHTQTTFMMSFVMQVCLLTERVLALFHHFTEFLASPLMRHLTKKKKKQPQGSFFQLPSIRCHPLPSVQDLQTPT